MNFTDTIERKERELAQCEQRLSDIRDGLRSLVDTAQSESRALDDFEKDIFDEYEAEALALKRHIPLLRASLDADRQSAESLRGMSVWNPF